MHALEVRPIEISMATLTRPSVADTLTSVTPGILFRTVVAFIAQSGQSIPRRPHSNSVIPSASISGSSILSIS